MHTLVSTLLNIPVQNSPIQLFCHNAILACQDIADIITKKQRNYVSLKQTRLQVNTTVVNKLSLCPKHSNSVYSSGITSKLFEHFYTGPTLPSLKIMIIIIIISSFRFYVWIVACKHIFGRIYKTVSKTKTKYFLRR